MADCRETCNLFLILKMAKKYPSNKKYYHQRFWKLIKNPTKLMFEDTFKPIICKIFGHIEYNLYEGSPETACKRCHRFVNKETINVIRDKKIKNVFKRKIFRKKDNI